MYGKELSQEYIDSVVSVYARFLIKNPEQRCSHEQLNTLGAIGCYLSHMICWQIIVDENLEYAFIFEDDLSFINNFMDILPKYISKHDKDADVFSFGYSSKHSCKNKKDYTKCKFFGTQGYYVTNEGAKKLLRYSLPIENHVDGYISVLSNIEYINLVFSSKSLIYQNNITGTSVGSSIYCFKCILPHDINTNIFYISILFLLYTFIVIVLTCIIKEKIKVFFH